MENLVGILALVITIIVAIIFLRRETRKETPDKDYFAGKKTTKSAAGSDDRNWPAIVKKALKSAKTMSRPAVALTMAKGPIAEDPHSSIGGQPSLPTDAPWPEGRDGKQMIFLAQINFADMPSLDGYPSWGVLSFFVEDNDLNGCDFPSSGNTGFQVLYHEDPDTLQRREPPVRKWDFSPFNEELTAHGRRLTGSVVTGSISPNSAQGRKLTEDWYPDCPSDLWDSFHETLTEAKPALIYYGGHPDFTQDDFRHKGADLLLTEVLLQLGFVFDGEGGAEICWGDAGEACFLISKADLAERRFDRVAYNWDCS